MRTALRAVRSAGGGAFVALGTILGKAGAQVLLSMHRRERVAMPPPAQVDGHTFDVVADLVDFTALPETIVVAMLRRRLESHRVEWHLFPRRARSEHWFYRASRAYLFANAIHDSRELAAELALLVPPGGRVLDFGGGTGNLTLCLAARAIDVDYLELSALQKEFVRYRVHKHGLSERVTVLDDWIPLRSAHYDLLCAFDVLEHLPNLDEELAGRLLPSLKADAVIAELSPFVTNLSNPMHFEDAYDLRRMLAEAGFQLESSSEDRRIWRRTIH